MSHQDGRCASDGETVVVTSAASIPSSIPTGKRVVIIRGSVTGTVAWTLSGSPQVTIIGQNTGVLTGNGGLATMRLTGGDFYVRDLSITGGAPGIWASGGTILHLDHVDVSNNTNGGILLDGVGFDIKNTTVSGNGANTTFSSVFGGIRVQGSTSPKSISLVTVANNALTGITCDSSAAFSPTPTTVRALTNVGGDVANCGFVSCGTPSASCGAQP